VLFDASVEEWEATCADADKLAATIMLIRPGHFIAILNSFAICDL
jgi:hypothetical protein